MHKSLQAHLRSAVGSSEFVVAINLDIRGFSSFFSDSSQAAAYLGSMYTSILDDYFPELSYFKPTGDGLLIVRTVDRDNINETVRSSVESALNLRDGFADLCKGDPLLNFPLPELVGIGIARGTATRLFDGEFTLDYSGLPLNLASRLMDLARPSGVVFAGLGEDLVTDELLANFTRDEVYVRGLADAAPIQVFKSSDVRIPVSNLTPFGTAVFKEDLISMTYKELKTRGRFIHPLTHIPVSDSTIAVTIVWPIATETGRKHKTMVRHFTSTDWTYQSRDPKQLIMLYDQVAKSVERDNCKDPWTVDVLIEYAASLESIAASSSRKSAKRINAVGDDAKS